MEVPKSKTKRNHEKPTETNVNLFTNMDDIEYSESRRSRSRGRSMKIDVIPVIIVVLLVLLAVASYMLYTAIGNEGVVDSKGNIKEEISSLSPTLCGNRTNWCDQGYCAPHRSRRIVDGRNSRRNEWPWMAEVLVDDLHACGGTLVTNRHILTAAHCVQTSQEKISTGRVTVKLGSLHLLSKDVPSQSVCQITIHEDFDNESMYNDIAIIRLQNSIPLNQSVWPACIPSAEGATQTAGKSAVMLGWGKSNYSSEFKKTLQQAKVPIVSTTTCEKTNNNIFQKVRISTSHNICAGYGKRSPEYGCAGDSGGPLMSRTHTGQWKVDGIMSWGDPSCESDVQDTYTVFTDVAQYEQWIADLMVM